MALTPDHPFYWVVPPHEPELPNRLPYFAFRPRKDIDQGMLSVYDATAITPAECLNLYNRRGDRQPATTVARITAGDFQRYGREIRSASGSHPAHCLVDFQDLSQSQINRISRDLRRRSERLGLIRLTQA